MSETDTQSDDFISLASIKYAILNFFKILFKAFDAVAIAIHRNRILILIFCLVGMALGYVTFLMRPVYYKTEMIVYQNDLTRKAYYEIVNNLNSLITTQSYASFASQLHIDKEVAQKVIFIEALSINNEPLIKDTSTKAGQPFKIQVKMRDNNITAPLQKALLDYLNNNPFVTQVKEGQKKIYQEKLEFIKREQSRLDSLKETYNRNLATMKLPTTFYNNALNPADLYRQSSDLDSQKEAILKWLNNESKAVLLIDGFKTTATPQSSSAYIPTLIGLGVGAAIGILLSLLAAVKKEANSY
jgi:hypothetical protein